VITALGTTEQILLLSSLLQDLEQID
jgi:hypothetical protein